MTLTARALFIIERNLQQELSLNRIAEACGVSRFHLARAFANSTRRTVMDYVRGRRLTEAARTLAGGAPNILDVALVAGYQSHEAFSRAFRAQLGITPEALRGCGTLDGLKLTEILHMQNRTPVSLAPPRFESANELLFVGLAASRRMGDAEKIPAQWRAFMTGPYRTIMHRLDGPPVGINVPTDVEEEFLYLCAAGVSRFERVAGSLEQVRVPPARYAVFSHAGHVSELPQTYAAIWNEWFSSGGVQPLRAPSLERHDASFDPRTGEGGVTLWIPVAAA